MPRVSSLGALGVWLVASSAAAAELPPDQRILDDRADVDIMRTKQPQAFELFTRGEAALASGQTRAAADLFAQSQALYPSGAVTARRRCQVLTELGQRATAIEECQRAITNGGSFLDHRALVGALVAGDGPLTTEELATASHSAQSAKEHVPSLPWGYAADCDIARRLGDEGLLRTCTQQLTTLAPTHYETQRAQAELRAASSLRGQVAFWVAFILGSIATLLHALRGASRRRILPSALGLLICSSVTLHASAADVPPAASGLGGQGVPGVTKGFSKWSINSADPSSSIPTKEKRDGNPLEYGYFLMDLTEGGDRAMKAKDYEAAVRYYVALATAVPDASRGFAKTCEAYEALGDRQKGLEYCALAISLRGSRLVDYGRFARLVLARPGRLTDLETNDLSRINGHLQTIEGGPDLAQSIECEIGVRNEDLKRLEQCTQALAKKEPNAARTITYQFAYALARKDEHGAAQAIQAAKAAALPAAAIQKMESSLTLARPAWRRFLGSWQFVLALVTLLAAVGAIVALTTRRRLRPQTA